MDFNRKATKSLLQLIADLQYAYAEMGDVPVLVEDNLKMMLIKSTTTVQATSRPTKSGEQKTVRFVVLSNRDPQEEGPPLPEGAVKTTFCPNGLPDGQTPNFDSTPFFEEVNAYLDEWANRKDVEFDAK